MENIFYCIALVYLPYFKMALLSMLYDMYSSYKMADNSAIASIIEFKNIFFSRTTGTILTKPSTKHASMKGVEIYLDLGSSFFSIDERRNINITLTKHVFMSQGVDFIKHSNTYH